jgi:predicted dehydrogenase
VIRLALVGFGKWGRNYVKAAHDSGEAEVTHVVLREGSPSRGAADKAGIEVVSRLDGIDIDAVAIAIHPSLAPWVAQAAMRQGFPVMIEKPAALSVADAHELAMAEAETGRLVLVGHQHLFSGVLEKMRIGLQDQRASDAHVTFTGTIKRSGYSPVWDYGPHAISATIALLGGQPVIEKACGDSDHCTLRLVRGSSAVMATFGIPREGLSSRQKAASILAAGYTYDGYDQSEPPLTRQVRAFAKAVRNGGTDDYRFGAHWAVDVSRVLEST